MGSFRTDIDPETASWLEAQPLFFVSTAPLASDGHVNVSPKGLHPIRVLGPQQVCYLDLTGSGAETMAHLRENGRITVMACSFGQVPRIVRLYGQGRTIGPGSSEWAGLRGRFDEDPGDRTIVIVDVHRVGRSCGFGVPVMDDPRPRHRLRDFASARGSEGLEDYRRSKNASSIDGLPAWPLDDEG